MVLDCCRTILDCIDEPAIVVDSSSRIVFVNKAFTILIGRNVVSVSFQDLFLDDVPDIHLHANEREPLVSSVHLQLPDSDESFVVDLSGRSFHAEDGSLSTIVFVSKHAESDDKAGIMGATAQQTPDAFFLFDEQDRIVEVNDAAVQSLGYSRDELIGKTTEHVDLLFGSDQWDELKTVQLREGSSAVESIHRRKDGSVFPVEIRCGWIMHQGKRYQLASARNITKNKQAQEELSAGRARYRSLFNSLIEACMLLKRQNNNNPETWTILETNPAFSEALGFISQDIHGKPVVEVMPEFAGEWARRCGEVMQTGTPVRIEGWTVTPERRYDISVFRLDEDTCAVTFIDVTERYIAEESLRTHSDYLERVFEMIPGFVFIKDSEGRFTKVNSALADFFGLSPEEVVGRTFAELDPDTVEGRLVGEEDQRVLGLPSGTCITSERKVTGRDSQTRWLQTIKAPLDLEPGGASTILGIGIDLTEKIQLEKSLRRSEEHLRMILENVGDIVYSLNREGVISFSSPSLDSVLGYTDTQIIGHRFDEFIHPDDAATFCRFVENVFKRGESQSGVEYRVRHADGHWVWQTSTASCVKGETEDDYQLVGVARDITESKAVEDVLIEQRSFLRQLIDLNPNHIYVKDRDERYILVNQAMADFYGMTSEELIGKRLEDIPGGISNSLAVAAENAGVLELDPHEVHTNVRKMLGADGELHWLQLYKSPIHDTEGEVNAFLGVSMDITELIEAENALRGSEEKLRAIVNAAGQVIYLLSPDGVLTFISPACTKVLGYEVDELLGKHYREIMHPADIDKVAASIEEIVSDTRHSEVTEFRVRRRNGMWAWMSSSATLMMESDGTVSGLVGIADDITERRFIEEELRVAHAELEERVARRTEELRRLNEELAHEVTERSKAETALEHRILALTQPNLELRHLSLLDVVDRQILEGLQRDIYGFDNLNSWILDTDGSIVLPGISQIQFCNLLFHAPEAGTVCRIPYEFTDDNLDPRIIESGQTPEMIAGLVPIVVDKIHVATWVIGWALLEGMTDEILCDLARAVSIDEQTFLHAANDMRRMTRQAFAEFLDRLKRVVQQISLLALQNLQQARLITQRKEAEQALKEAHDQLEQKVQERTRELSAANQALKQEIAERISIERRLREEERNLAEAQRIAHLGGWKWDFDSPVMQCSREMLRIYGRETEDEQIPIHDYLEAIHHDDRAMIEAVFDTSLEQLQPFDISHRIIAADGKEKHVRQVGEVGAGDDGTATYLVGTVRDITDQAWAETALEWESSVNAAVAALSSSLLTAHSLAHISQLVLKHICEISGSPLGYVGYLDYNAGILICPAVTQGFWDDDIDTEAVDIQQLPSLYSWVLERNEPVISNSVADDPRFTDCEKTRGQITRFVSVPAMLGEGLVGQLTLANASTDYNDKDLAMLSRFATLYALAVERKRAEEDRKHLEEQIQHAQKLESLGVLAGGIAHDFNNLLVGILGNADLALMDMPESTSARAWVEAIRNAGLRASELTNQMLAYSGKGQFVIENVNLNILIQDMVNLVRASISKSAVLSFNLSPTLPPMEGDSSQIRQIVMNLIINASDALGEKSGAISVSTGVTYADADYLAGPLVEETLEEGDYIFLEVSDTGCGMDETTLRRIFDPFFTTKFTGRGLGLAAVLGIIRGHHGTIKVESTPGEGTTFRILFPVSRVNESADNPPDDIGTTWSQAGTVLIVDDEAGVRSVATAILHKYGFATMTAADGAEGVELFREHADDISLVILDMTMGEMNGQAAFQEMRAIRDDVRVILASGYSEQEADSRFSEEGLRGFIQKPFQINTLMEAIRAALVD